MLPNPKPEGRRPKEILNPNSEKQNQPDRGKLRDSDFAVLSAFGVRVSDLSSKVAAVLAAVSITAMAGTVGPESIRPTLYDRATMEFTNAAFLKPLDTESATLPSQLAPMLLQETLDTNGLDLQDQPGTPVLTNGALSVTLSRPALFVHADSVEVQGRPHARFSYIWAYPSADLQGVRLTLNTAGEPAIWEVLAKVAGRRLIFVSESLEAAAKAQFGPPLPGRRYSSEPGLTDAPDLMVARVLADGPVPMGPMVYLRHGTHEVATLACRCMPLQAKAIAATTNYALVPLNYPAQLSLLSLVRQQSHTRTAYWPQDAAAEQPLSQRLRLPAKF